ncbi:MAG: homocysteine S-methyltransferase family protein [Roseovarius sp.]
MARDFMEPDRHRTYLTEGGTETEIMFRHGYDFPHFAVFELLKNPAATQTLRGMFADYLDAVAESGLPVLLGGLDYRASPDWGALLGYSPEGLREMQARCIAFLREVAKPYEGQIPEIRIVGIIGPRGDAYALNEEITAEAAEEYHAVQLETLKALDVDLAWGATLNNIPEAVGLSRAAAKAGVPLCLAFTVTETARLRSGPTLKEAVQRTDAEAGAMAPMCYGVNCSHPDEFAPAIEPGGWFERVRSVRPNAAKMDKLALCKLNHLEEGDPVELGRQLGDLARAHPHIDIWGGCCGTWEKHVREIASNVTRQRA